MVIRFYDGRPTVRTPIDRIRKTGTPPRTRIAHLRAGEITKPTTKEMKK